MPAHLGLSPPKKTKNNMYLSFFTCLFFLCLTSRLAASQSKGAEIVRKFSVTWFCTGLSIRDTHSLWCCRYCVHDVCQPLFIAVAEDGMHTTYWTNSCKCLWWGHSVNENRLLLFLCLSLSLSLSPSL